MTFSSLFRTFASWAKGKNRNTRYFREIARKHAWAPDLALKELRKASLSSLDPTNISYDDLTPVQRVLRNDMSQILSEIRKGRSLTQVVREEGYTLKEVKKYLSSYLKLRNGRYVAKSTTRFERGRWMYSNGKRVSLTVRSDADASLISRYLAKVRRALNKNNPLILKEFEGKYVTDVYGIKYSFETDIPTIRKLNEMTEDSEEVGIYEYPR